MSEPISSPIQADLPVSDVAATDVTSSDVYHSALVRAFVFQVFFALLACRVLDGGIFRRVFCGVSVVYWLGALGVLMARPSHWGLRYLRHGVLVVFGLTVVAIEVGYKWIVDVVSR